MGQLKISEMRQRAETELKEKFDIKDFHEVSLYLPKLPVNENRSVTSGDTSVFIYRQFRQIEKKHFPKYLSFDVIWQLPVCCLNVACQVLLESAGPLSLVEKRVEQWMERSMAKKF